VLLTTYPLITLYIHTTGMAHYRMLKRVCMVTVLVMIMHVIYSNSDRRFFIGWHRSDIAKTEYRRTLVAATSAFVPKYISFVSVAAV